jgi:hypothetical protein
MPVKMEQTECSETSAYKLQTPGNYQKESIQHLEHSESLKSTVTNCFPEKRLIEIDISLKPNDPNSACPASLVK